MCLPSKENSVEILNVGNTTGAGCQIAGGYVVYVVVFTDPRHELARILAVPYGSMVRIQEIMLLSIIPRCDCRIELEII